MHTKISNQKDDIFKRNALGAYFIDAFGSEIKWFGRMRVIHPFLTSFMEKNFRLIVLSFLVGAVLIALRLALRGQEQWSNVTPLAAIAVCFGLFAPRLIVATCLAVGALLISDLAINLSIVDHGFWGLMLSPAMLLRYGLFAGLVIAASKLRHLRPSRWVFLWTPLASLIFYAVSNTLAWAVSSGIFAYTKTLAGWWQSQTVGLPGFMPSYLFLRNALIGDLIFSAAFVALVVCLPKTRDSLLNPAENPL